jgi:hypothetical protein
MAPVAYSLPQINIKLTRRGIKLYYARPFYTDILNATLYVQTNALQSIGRKVEFAAASS